MLKMLSLSTGRSLAETLAPARIDVAGRPIVVSFRRNARAKRLILRLDRQGGGVSVTLPPRMGRERGLAFALASRDWIGAQLAGRPGGQALAPGVRMPLRGVDHEVRLAPERRGLVRLEPEGPAILVPGGPAHAPRRLRDWLKGEAKRALTEASRRHAAAMGLRFKRLSVRDQASRWGSCSARGHLSYSWRLILAPDLVLDYVAAHEVAHLRHMHHGPAFWRLVVSHCPHAARARAWLKRHGAELHRYGS